MKLTNNELKQINGGAIGIGGLILIGLGVAFIVGIVDGYFRPQACN